MLRTSTSSFNLQVDPSTATELDQCSRIIVGLIYLLVDILAS